MIIMKQPNTTPKINNPELVEYYNSDPVQQVTHERLSRMSAEDLAAIIPEVQTAETVEGHAVQYAILRGNGEVADEQAQVLFLPFGNGWAMHTFIRALQIHEGLGGGADTIIFPNATPGNVPYELSQEERAQVATGRLDIIAEKQLRAVEALGKSALTIIGYSQGAGVGGAAIRRATENGSVNVERAHLGEPANAMARPPSQLQKAFTATGLKPLITAVNDAGIPTLSEVQHTRGGLDTTRLLGGFVGVLRGSQMPVNKALHEAMTHNTFFSDVEKALRENPDLVVVLTGTEYSKIYPREIAEATTQSLRHLFPGRVFGQEILGRGHEAADNTTEYTASIVRSNQLASKK